MRERLDSDDTAASWINWITGSKKLQNLEYCFMLHQSLFDQDLTVCNNTRQFVNRQN